MCGLVTVHDVVVVICSGGHRSAMPPAAAADGLGSGDARHQGATAVLGGVCPSAIIAVCNIFTILVLLIPITDLSLAFAFPDAIVMALFVGSSSIVIRDVVIRSGCTQHCCNARLCSKVPKMPLSAMSSTSSFSCVSVCTATFVNGKKEGNGNGDEGGGQGQ